MKLVNKYPYSTYSKRNTDIGRMYETPTGNLPSVTTILSSTKSKESIKNLQNWKNRVGEENAAKITTEAANVGTIVHNILENWILNKTYDPGNNLIHRQAKNMAEIIKQNIEPNIEEVWGSEVNLFYPDLYAGTTDLSGLWKSKPAIMDFKQTNKPKKKEWIEDYFLQLAAYASAHDELYGTHIKNGAIFMCSRDGQFQLFEIENEEFDHWKEQWAIRVNQYYNK